MTKYWKEGLDKCNIVTEILDTANSNNIEYNPRVQTASEFLLINEMLSCMLAMIAEDRGMNAVLQEMMNAEGSSLYIKDMRRYCSPGEHHSFMSLSARVQEFEETMIGYIDPVEGPVLNPDDKTLERMWEDCEVIVLANRKEALGTDVIESCMGTRKPICNPRHSHMQHILINGFGVPRPDLKDLNVQDFSKYDDDKKGPLGQSKKGIYMCMHI